MHSLTNNYKIKQLPYAGKIFSAIQEPSMHLMQSGSRREQRNNIAIPDIQLKKRTDEWVLYTSAMCPA
jgi:hypothetical protein